MLTGAMNLLDLNITQLKRAVTIKEQIDQLNKELGSILGAPATSATASKNQRTMSAAVKKKIAATQRARWANLRRAKSTTRSGKPAAQKKAFSAATRAKLSAKLKAYWAAKRAGKK
jgi:truncated hemoglobin YjbI